MTPGFDDTILKHFSSLEDPRIERSKQHLLEDIVAIAILAVIGGADSWVAIETYAQVKQDWLVQFLALPNGIPSYDKKKVGSRKSEVGTKKWFQAPGFIHGKGRKI